MSSNPIQNVTPGRLRIDYGRADRYIYPEPPKLNFGQKLLRGLGKTVSFLGPIGAAVAAVAGGPFGLPIAAGVYGLSGLAADQTNKALMKDQIKASAQPQPTNVTMPGLFDTGQSPGLGATDFIAPSHLEPQIGEVMINREMSRGEAEGTLRQ